MLNRQLFSVAAKQLGRRSGQLQRQVKRSESPRSWQLSSCALNPYTSCMIDIEYDNCCALPEYIRFDTNNRRHFSDMSLRRPPSKYQKNGFDSDTKQKWRSHAISLGLGNYQDDFEYDDHDEYADSKISLISNDSTNSARTATSPAWDEEESILAEQVQEIQQKDDDRRKRWLENAKPPLRHSIVDERGRAYGRGGRKTASARVWIQPGFGNVVINRKDFVDYFDRTSDRELILEPLAATETLGRFDINAIVEGGGSRGQAGAIRHGLARALNHFNPNAYRPPLKRLGYLTRDPRKVERKKIGHLKARKKPQWVKR